MGIDIIHHRKRVEQYTYSLVYVWKEDPNAGFDFPCDNMGNLLMKDMAEAGLKNYERCEMGEYKDLVEFRGICKIDSSYNEPAIGRCYCGEEIALETMTNTCQHCGREYNGFGQLLSDHSCWGEETGEHPSDVERWTR